MALIRCPECGREVSEFAPHCIGCGCPMAVIKKMTANNADGFKPNLETRYETKEKLLPFRDNLTGNETKFIARFENQINELYEGRISIFHRKYYLGLKVTEETNVRYAFKKTAKAFKFCYINKENNHKEVELTVLDNIMEAQLLGIVKNNLPSILPQKDILASTSKKALSNDFLSRLSDGDAAFINKFDQFLSLNLLNVTIQNNKNTRTYFEVSGRTRTKICWFTYKHKKLLLKFYSWSDDGKTIVTKKPTALDYETIIDSIFDTKLKFDEKKIANTPKIEKIATKAKTLRPYFLSTLTPNDRNYVESFTKNLLESYGGIETSENETGFFYKEKNKEFSIFWFAVSNRNLVFKYRRSIAARVAGDVNTIYIGDPLSPTPEQIVKKLFSSVEDSPKKKKVLLPITKLIVKSFSGKNLFENTKEGQLAKDIAEYTTDYIFNKYKEEKRFKTREEFDRFKNRYSDYTYHGRRISFKYFSEDDAVFIFKYYIASRYLGIIQKYEKLLNENIITDYKELLDEYYELVNSGRDDFNNVKGINSNISAIPFSVFEEEQAKYYLNN